MLHRKNAKHWITHSCTHTHSRAQQSLIYFLVPIHLIGQYSLIAVSSCFLFSVYFEFAFQRDHWQKKDSLSVQYSSLSVSTCVCACRTQQFIGLRIRTRTTTTTTRGDDVSSNNSIELIHLQFVLLFSTSYFHFAFSQQSAKNYTRASYFLFCSVLLIIVYFIRFGIHLDRLTFEAKAKSKTILKSFGIVLCNWHWCWRTRTSMQICFNFWVWIWKRSAIHVQVYIVVVWVTPVTEWRMKA